MAARGPQNGGRGLERCLGRSKQLSLNKFFDPRTTSMRKGRDRGKNKGGGHQEKTDDYSGHYVIAGSRPPERRPLERRMLVPKGKSEYSIKTI